MLEFSTCFAKNTTLLTQKEPNRGDLVHSYLVYLLMCGQRW